MRRKAMFQALRYKVPVRKKKYLGSYFIYYPVFFTVNSDIHRWEYFLQSLQ